MGVEKLSDESSEGIGATIAILDSGVPKFLRAPTLTSYCERGTADDVFGHATEVSSVIFGGVGIHGICENAEPLFIKVLDDDGNGSVEDVSSGILEAVRRNADIINLSLGFERVERCPSMLEEACLEAYESGVAIICAAGNDGGCVGWPSALKTTA